MSARRKIAQARSLAEVGLPYWSATTDTTPCSRARRSTVLTKFLPTYPYSHAVRTTNVRSQASRAKSSPAHFDLPYADTGHAGSSSRRGRGSSPENT